MALESVEPATKSTGARFFRRVASLLLPIVISLVTARAESGHDAWLRYAPIHDASVLQKFDRIVVLGETEVLQSARTELARGLQSMLGRTLPLQKEMSSGAIVLLSQCQSVRLFAGAVTSLPRSQFKDSLYGLCG